MKLSAAVLLSVFVSAGAFAPAAFTRGVVTAPVVSTTTVFSEPAEEEGGLDLDLGEMFEM